MCVYIVACADLTGISELTSYCYLQHVVAGVRSSSASKPAVSELKSRGVEIRLLDLENGQAEDRVKALQGVDTVITTIAWTQLQSQKPLIDAAKEAGVRRFIPCDWGTTCARGVRKVYDEVGLF